MTIKTDVVDYIQAILQNLANIGVSFVTIKELICATKRPDHVVRKTLKVLRGKGVVTLDDFQKTHYWHINLVRQNEYFSGDVNETYSYKRRLGKFELESIESMRHNYTRKTYRPDTSQYLDKYEANLVNNGYSVITL